MTGLCVREIAEGHYRDAYERFRPMVASPSCRSTYQQLPDVIEAGVRSGHIAGGRGVGAATRDVRRRQRHAHGCVECPTAARPCWRRTTRQRTCTAARSSTSESRPRRPTSAGRTSCTASGCDAVDDGGRRATSCGSRSAIFDGWAHPPSRTGRAVSSRPPASTCRPVHRVAVTGAHRAGVGDRTSRRRRADERGDRRRTVHQRQHRRLPPAQGVPEARGHLSAAARRALRHAVKAVAAGGCHMGCQVV